METVTVNISLSKRVRDEAQGRNVIDVIKAVLPVDPDMQVNTSINTRITDD